MATISAGDLILLRTNSQKATPYLSVMQPVTLLSALVNNGSIERGARSITYDTGSGSGYATIGEGMTLEVDTSTGTQKIRVKSITGNQSAGTITVDENGIVWGNNNAIRIYHNYEVFPIPPVIRSGVFYKFYDVAYSTQNSTPSPVAIAGSHRAGFLSGGSIVFNLNATASYAVAQGASISSYLWSCVRNGGGTSGITIASASSASTTLTITTIGTYWLSLTVTDSNGQMMTTHRAVFVYDTDNMPYVDFVIQSLTGDWSSGGWRASLSVTGEASLTDFPDGALVVLWYVNYFNNTEDYVNLWGISDNIITCGYLRSDTDRNDWSNGTGEVTFQISTIDDLLNNISQLGSVSLNAVASPSTWYQYASWMTAGRSVHHLLRWQSWGVFETCDVLGLTTNSQGVLNTDYTEASLLQQINNFTYNRGIFAKLICDRLGRLHLVQDSQMLNTAARAALDTVFTLVEADISGTVDVVRSPEQNIVFSQLDGFAFNGSNSTPYLSIIPGYRPGSVSFMTPEFRGGSMAAVSNQILSSQTDSNERLGRYHALQNNNPREIRFALPGNYLGAFDIIPSIGWYAWGIADADLKRNLELYNRLFVCRNITHQFSYGDTFTGFIQTSVVLEPEAIGPDGIQGNYPVSYPIPALPTPSCDLTISPLSLVYDTLGNGVISAISTSKAVAIDSRDAYVLSINEDAITAGTVETLSENASDSVLQTMSAAQVLVVYREAATNNARACVLDVSGTTLTQGTAALVDNTGNCADYDTTYLSATKAITVYRQSTANQGKACILDISGSTVTPGTSAVFVSDFISGPKVAALTSTKTVAIWQSSGFEIEACVLDISGSAITPGATTTIKSGTPLYGGVDIIALSSSTLFCSYRQNEGNLYGRVLSVSGTTITLGTEMTITGVAGVFGGHLCGYDENTVLCVVVDGISPPYTVIRAITLGISGTSASVNEITTRTLDTFYGIFNLSQLDTEKAIMSMAIVGGSEARIVWCD